MAPGEHPLHKRLFRDLSKPVGALDKDRLDQILDRFSNMSDGASPFSSFVLPLSPHPT
jgi:phosphoglycerol transferase MdoB-like AlkP superfamily enzyme